MLTIAANANTTSDISYAISGTANTSQDFVFNNTPSVIAGTIAMSGQSLQIPLTITDNGDNAEGPETIIITLTDIQGSHVQLGANTTFIVTINDNAGLPFINFSTASSEGLEDQPGILTAQLSRTSAQNVTFQWSADNASTTAINIETVLGGTTFPADFTNAPVVPIDVIIPAGQLTATIDLGIQNDNLYEPTESIEAGITGALTNAQFGTNLNHVYTILDNDTPVAAPAVSGTAIPQSTASVGGVPAGSVVVVPTPVVTSPTPDPTPTAPGQVLGVQTSLVHELIAKLKFGSTNNEVTQLQVELQKLGFFPAKAKTTCFYGLVTKAAVQKYLDTKANEISLQELATMLKIGQRGTAVKNCKPN